MFASLVNASPTASAFGDTQHPVSTTNAESRLNAQ